MEWFVDRMTEPSTWRGLVGLLTSAGIIVSPELATQIVAAGLAVMGLINVIRKEHVK